jgi:hypothetical protein
MAQTPRIASASIPSVLERLDEGLWIAAVPLSFLGLRIGTRMTVARLAGGDLWIHSPIELGAELRREVDELGSVGHLVAPNLYHHRFVQSWRAAYPNAIFHGPKALRRKRKDLVLSATLEEAPAASWASELTPVHIDGCMLDETVFVHRPTRTLVSADLTENFATSPHWPTRAYLKASGLHGRVGFSRFLRPLYRDRKAARRSLDALLEHDFDRIVIAHGDVIGREGKAAIRQTFDFLGVG